MIQSHETWVKRCEEARRAEDAAREAGHIFKISDERFLAAKEVEEARSTEAAEKVRQASQSNYKKKNENLEADLNNLLLAIKKCGWAKAKEGHGPTMGREEVKRWKSRGRRKVSPV